MLLFCCCYYFHYKFTDFLLLLAVVLRASVFSPILYCFSELIFSSIPRVYTHTHIISEEREKQTAMWRPPPLIEPTFWPHLSLSLALLMFKRLLLAPLNPKCDDVRSRANERERFSPRNYPSVMKMFSVRCRLKSSWSSSLSHVA
jgi:hypothetical protein